MSADQTPTDQDRLGQRSGLGTRPSPAQVDRLPAHVWPRGAARAASGEVTLGGIGVGELAERFDTPLFAIDEDDFRSRCREIAEAFGGAANVNYASKAFLSAETARWIDDEGLSMDVASGGELAVALHGGFPPARITMHGNNKSEDELARAVTAGVGHVVLDSLQEISRLDRIAGAHGRVQDVMIRLTVGVEAHTHEAIATAHEDQKFGFSIAGGDAAKAVDAVLASPHLRLTGLHSHIGSQIFEIDGFEMAAHRVIGFLAETIDRHGPDATAALDTVDLGGGLGIAYTEDDDPPPVAELAEKLTSIVAAESAAVGLPVPRLLVEPGRAIAGPGTITVYRVGTVKHVQVEPGLVRRYISVDGGMSDNIRPALYDARYDVRLVSRSSAADPVVSRVVGKHCESGDIIIDNAWLPGDVAPGDLIAVAATGAYCYSMSSRYNMVTRPAVAAVRDGAARLILRRETEDDLLSLEVS